LSLALSTFEVANDLSFDIIGIGSTYGLLTGIFCPDPGIDCRVMAAISPPRPRNAPPPADRPFVACPLLNTRNARASFGRSFSTIMNPATNNIWEQVKSAYRRSCDLARAGDGAASTKVLRDEVIPRFSEWARLTGCGEENRRVFIDNLMRQERRRVQSAWVRHHVESRDRRSDLENAIKQERRDLQREWAIQTDIGQQFTEIAVNLPAPVDYSVPVVSDNRPASAAPAPSRLAIDDVPNIIDFVLQEQANRAAAPAPNQAVA
jgi:hypothetical protein